VKIFHSSTSIVLIPRWWAQDLMCGPVTNPLKNVVVPRAVEPKYNTEPCLVLRQISRLNFAGMTV
jgi:hypothetical protein